MYWELWDIKSKNLVETFDTEDEAIQGVRDLLSVNRPDLVDDLVLGAMYDEDEPEESPLPPTLSGESLSARLAEALPVDDATHAVHEKIRRWLTEEGWRVDDLSKPGWPLNIRVTVDGGQSVDIFQHETIFGRVTLSQGWIFDPEFRSKFSKLPDSTQRSVIYNIYRDVLTAGLDLIRLDASLTEMKYGSFIYFDGLTKETLMQRVLHIVRMHHLTMRTFGWGFAEAGQTVPLNIMDYLPPQTAAS
ncbi:MAG: DUF2299 family protein [Chloroflexota bacterium]